MNILFVFLIIFTVIFLILSVKISFCFEFYNVRKEKREVYIKVAFFKYMLFPAKEKKISKEKHIKTVKKESKKKVKKEAEKSEPAKYDIREILEFIKEPLNRLLAKFKKYLRIDAADINILVASGDAYKTALTFGAVSQSVWYIKALLEHNLNAEVKNINISSDFAGTKTKFDINLKLSIRFYQALSIAFTSAAAFVKWISRNKKAEGKILK